MKRLTEVLAPEQKRKLQIPVAIAAGLVGVGCLLFACYTERVTPIIFAACMVGVIVVAIGSHRSQQ